jgi:hypothetical protein
LILPEFIEITERIVLKKVKIVTISSDENPQFSQL